MNSDIIIEILSKMECREAIHFRVISKEWKSIIDQIFLPHIIRIKSNNDTDYIIRKGINIINGARYENMILIILIALVIYKNHNTITKYFSILSLFIASYILFIFLR